MAGCTADHTISPVAWWHGLQGGVIAEQRPPPPGVTDPYPNLAVIPKRPPPPNVTEQTRIGAGLEVDRVTAETAAAQDPLPQPHAPAAPPAPTAPPPNPGNATAQVAAAEAPPAPAAAPAASVAAPPAAGPASAPGPAGTPGLPAGGSLVPGPVPEMPAAPPDPPVLSGLVIPLPPPAPPAPAPSLAGVKPAESVIVPFPLGTADLPAQAAASLKALATRRNGVPVAVVAHGEAASNAPGAQAAGLALGLKRAQVMADALTAAGVPAAALRIDAQALGRGGVVRLID